MFSLYADAHRTLAFLFFIFSRPRTNEGKEWTPDEIRPVCLGKGEGRMEREKNRRQR
jgi:hypothetical protein